MNTRHGTKTWKSSSLAVLEGLGNNLQAELGGLASMEMVEERANDIRVRLVEDEEEWGWRLISVG